MRWKQKYHLSGDTRVRYRFLFLPEIIKLHRDIRMKEFAWLEWIKVEERYGMGDDCHSWYEIGLAD